MALATRSDEHSHPDLATKAEVEGRFGEIMTEIARLRGEFAELRGEHRGEITALQREMDRLRAEMAAQREETVRLGKEVAELRGSVKLLMWGIGIGFAATFAGFGILAAVLS